MHKTFTTIALFAVLGTLYSDRALVTCYEDCMLGKFSVKYEQVLMLLKHDAGIID